MSPGRRTDSGSSARCGEHARVRRARRLARRYGLGLEATLSVVALVGFAVALFSLLIGFGEHGESGPGRGWTVLFYGSWIGLLLVLTGLGALVVGNAVLPLVRIDGDAITVDRDRFRTRPWWSRTGHAIKFLCAAVVVTLGGPLLLSVVVFALESVLPVPAAVVAVRRVWTDLSLAVLPWAAVGLVLSVFGHALVRAVGAVFDAVR